MKTVTELNKKALYRLVKALYFFVLVGVIIYGVKYFYEDSIYYPMDYSQIRITCKNNEGKYYDIKKSTYNIDDNLTIEQKNTIAKDLCGITNVQISEKHGLFEDAFLSSNNVFIASKGKMIEKLDILKFSGCIISILLGLLLLTEVLRRAIYYVVLGSLKPEK